MVFPGSNLDKVVDSVPPGPHLVPEARNAPAKPFSLLRAGLPEVFGPRACPPDE